MGHTAATDRICAHGEVHPLLAVVRQPVERQSAVQRATQRLVEQHLPGRHPEVRHRRRTRTRAHDGHLLHVSQAHDYIIHLFMCYGYALLKFAQVFSAGTCVYPSGTCTLEAVSYTHLTLPTKRIV